MTKNKKYAITLISLVCLLSMLFPSCGSVDSFKEIKQTSDEKKVVMQIGEYKVSKDFYSYLFYGFSTLYETKPVTEEEKAERLQTIHAQVLDAVATFYAYFEMAKELKVNEKNDTYKKTLNDLLEYTKNGGYFNNVKYQGFQNEEAYHASLESLHMNDFVYRQNLKKIAMNFAATDAYMTKENVSKEKKQEVVTSFLNSEDARKFTYAYLEYASFVTLVDDVPDYELAFREAENSANLLFQSLVAVKDDMRSFINKEIGASITITGKDTIAHIEDGTYVSRYHTDDYDTVNDAVFALSFEDVENNSDMSIYQAKEGIYILRLLPTSADDMTEDNLDDLYRTAMANEYYKKIAEYASSLKTQVITTAEYERLTYDSLVQP